MTRPWNLPNVPVYSLVTHGDGNINMNICTYVSAVSMKPKLYAVAVYRDTQTLHNLGFTDSAVLQLLGKEHLSVVNILGKRSGMHYDKHAYLAKKKLLQAWHGFTVLTKCAALLELEKISGTEAGDHTLFLFRVRRFATNHEKVLTLDDLRAKRLVRI